MDTANWGKFSMPPTSHLLGEAKTTIDQMYSVLSYMKTHLNHPVVGKVNIETLTPFFMCLLYSIIRHSGRKTHQLLTAQPPSWMPQEVSKWLVNGLVHLLINGVFLGVITHWSQPLILTSNGTSKQLRSQELLTSQQNLRRTIPYCDHLVRVPSEPEKNSTQRPNDRAFWGMKLGDVNRTQEPWLPDGIVTYMNGLNVWVSCR